MRAPTPPSERIWWRTRVILDTTVHKRKHAGDFVLNMAHRVVGSAFSAFVNKASNIKALGTFPGVAFCSAASVKQSTALYRPCND